MSDDAKRYPPSERKLARLWQAGSTPASAALVGVAVIVAGVAVLVFGGPAVFGWMSEWVRTSLEAAAEPESALAVVSSVALRGFLLAGGIAFVALASAVAVQVAQAGRRGDATPSTPARRGLAPALRFEGWRLGRAALLAAITLVAVSAATRGVLMGAPDVFAAERPLHTLIEPGRSVAGPLLIVLIAVAVLDTICGRTAWMKGAWMTRREVEEEMRETEGHPLTRQRRSVMSRRQHDA